MNIIPSKFKVDYECLYREPFRPARGLGRVVRSGCLLMMLCGRLGEPGRPLHRTFRWIFILLSRRRGIEIDYSDKIGGGVVLAHAYNITVNTAVRIAGPALLYKGCTLGGIRSGVRQGVPSVGSKVVVGLNATVVGGVAIGDDVFIAPNSFVNFDVPSHSVVVGNPGVVHSKVGATRDYFA